MFLYGYKREKNLKMYSPKLLHPSGLYTFTEWQFRVREKGRTVFEEIVFSQIIKRDEFRNSTSWVVHQVLASQQAIDAEEWGKEKNGSRLI